MLANQKKGNKTCIYYIQTKNTYSKGRKMQAEYILNT